MLSDEIIGGMMRMQVEWVRWIGKVNGRRTVAYTRGWCQEPIVFDADCLVMRSFYEPQK